MYNVDYNYSDGIFNISDKFDYTLPESDVNSAPYLRNPGDEYILSFPDLQNIKKLTKFYYEGLNFSPNRYLTTFYRISRNGNVWTDWLTLGLFVDNFPLVDTKDPLYLEVKWVRGGSEGGGEIRLIRYSLDGELERDLVGLRPVKDRIKEIAALLLVHRLRKLVGLTSANPNLHMSFTGSPGTGKTAVALKMADILFRLGYIRKGHLITVTRQDLVGQ
jgi:hypothetical protein